MAYHPMYPSGHYLLIITVHFFHTTIQLVDARYRDTCPVACSGRPSAVAVGIDPSFSHGKDLSLAGELFVIQVSHVRDKIQARCHSNCPAAMWDKCPLNISITLHLSFRRHQFSMTQTQCQHLADMAAAAADSRVIRTQLGWMRALPTMTMLLC